MPVPLLVGAIFDAAAGCVRVIGTVGAVIAKKITYRKYPDEFARLWKEIATCRAYLAEFRLMEIEKVDVQDLLEKVDLLKKEIATCRDQLEKVHLNEKEKVTGRMLREEVDMLEKEIATYRDHLERVRRIEIEITTHREHLAELLEIDAIWLKEEKYMVFLDEAGALNQRINVRKGRELLSGGLSREVAVKIIKKSDRTQKELAILQKLDHENVVKFIDFDEIETNGLGPHLYIIMELCECNLEKFMEKRKDRYLSIETFSLISKQLLGGLEYIHRNGLIHRDIKPDNILVIQDKRFKYSDFGITKEILHGAAEVTQTRKGVGSDGYRAPETYRDGIVRISKAVDIFSLGIVLAQLISKGQHPYGSDWNFWRANIIRGEMMDLSNVGVGIREKKDQLIDVLTQMLSKDAGDRPSVEDIRNHKFFLNETSVVAGECIICYGNAATTAFIPCGHVHVCPDCAPRLDECPTCRAKIIRPMRVYPI